MSESFEVIVQDESKSILVDQLTTFLFGIPIEVVEVKFIDSELGIFSVMVSNKHEKTRLCKLGILEINETILTISGGDDEDLSLCPFCDIDMTSWTDDDKSLHTIACDTAPIDPTTEGPFTISCPYANCGSRVEARSFPKHAFQTHTKHKQDISCPICQLQGDTGYQIKNDTNLLNHLQTSHVDLIEPKLTTRKLPISRNIRNIIKPPTPNTTTVEYPLDQPSDYLVTISKCDSEDECPICYEFLIKGVKIARLPCLCVYHQTCIESWFTQKTARKCPLHGMDKT